MITNTAMSSESVDVLVRNLLQAKINRAQEEIERQGREYIRVTINLTNAKAKGNLDRYEQLVREADVIDRVLIAAREDLVRLCVSLNEVDERLLNVR